MNVKNMYIHRITYITNFLPKIKVGLSNYAVFNEVFILYQRINPINIFQICVSFCIRTNIIYNYILDIYIFRVLYYQFTKFMFSACLKSNHYTHQMFNEFMDKGCW